MILSQYFPARILPHFLYRIPKSSLKLKCSQHICLIFNPNNAGVVKMQEMLSTTTKVSIQFLITKLLILYIRNKELKIIFLGLAKILLTSISLLNEKKGF